MGGLCATRGTSHGRTHDVSTLRSRVGVPERLLISHFRCRDKESARGSYSSLRAATWMSTAVCGAESRIFNG